MKRILFVMAVFVAIVTGPTDSRGQDAFGFFGGVGEAPGTFADPTSAIDRNATGDAACQALSQPFANSLSAYDRQKLTAECSTSPNFGTALKASITQFTSRCFACPVIQGLWTVIKGTNGGYNGVISSVWPALVTGFVYPVGGSLFATWWLWKCLLIFNPLPWIFGTSAPTQQFEEMAKGVIWFIIALVLLRLPGDMWFGVLELVMSMGLAPSEIINAQLLSSGMGSSALRSFGVDLSAMSGYGGGDVILGSILKVVHQGEAGLTWGIGVGAHAISTSGSFGLTGVGVDVGQLIMGFLFCVVFFAATVMLGFYFFEAVFVFLFVFIIGPLPVLLMMFPLTRSIGVKAIRIAFKSGITLLATSMLAIVVPIVGASVISTSGLSGSGASGIGIFIEASGKSALGIFSLSSWAFLFFGFMVFMLSSLGRSLGEAFSEMNVGATGLTQAASSMISSVATVAALAPYNSIKGLVGAAADPTSGLRKGLSAAKGGADKVLDLAARPAGPGVG